MNISSEKPLDASVMKALGFKEIWPSGNPPEPWWENEDLRKTFYRMPSAEKLFSDIIEDAVRRGREEAIQRMREALDL